VITPATRVLDIVHLGDLVEVTAEDRPAAWAAVSVRLAVGPLERAGFARSRLHFDVSLTDPVHPQDAARYATLLDSLSADETDVPVLQPTDGHGRPRPTGNTLRTKMNKAGVNVSMARDRATKGGPGVAEMPPTVNNLSPDSNSAPSNVSGQGRSVNALRGSKIPSDQDQQSNQEPQPHVVAAQANESVGFHNQEQALLARITHRRQELFTELALSRQIRVQLEDLWPTRGGDFVGWLLWSLATPTIESPGIHAWSRVSDGQSPPEEYRQIVEVAAGWLESAYSPPPAAFREAGAALREARLSDALRRILFAADSSGETGENREGAGSVSGPLAGDDEGALRPTQEAARLWELARGQLQLELPRGDFDTWVRDLQPVRLEEGALVVRAGNEYAKRWIEDRLAASAARILSGLTPETRQLRIEVGGPSSDERARA
jgi:hypothetical protein